jgi:DnaJ like chaperone protein
MIGKVLGTLFGAMFLKIPGAILGLIIGHMFDKGYSQDFGHSGGFARFFTSPDQMKNNGVFFHALFSSMGHIAKANGRVTEEEIQIAANLMDQMNLTGDTRKEAQQAFREGKEADFPLDSILQQFFESCHGRRDILQIFLEILIQAAYADGSLDSKEQAVLEKVAKKLKFRQNELLYLQSVFEAEIRFRRGRAHNKRSHHQGRKPQYTEKQSLDDAYRILGVSVNADEKAIKKAYRKLMSEHHPDKLISKGLPKEAMELAKGKAQDIQAAYELIKQVKKSQT